jgi:hypothetical protein
MALCDDTNGTVIGPDQPCEDGCPILTKKRTVLADKGVCATVEWPLRYRNGGAVDLTSCFPNTDGEESQSETSVSADLDTASIVVRFAGCDRGGSIYEVDGTASDPTTGKIRFMPPPEVFNTAGIYQLSIGLKDIAGNVIFQEPGLLSVEPTLFGDVSQRTGPPTVRDLRIHLRDNPVENELLGDYEFDVSEIMEAVRYPVMQWNETPPPVARFNCANFPFTFHWRQAIVGELLRTAAHHYMRNEYQASHGGVTGNFKAKHRQYLELAELYSTEWRRFVRAKKIEINAGRAFSSLNSTYSSW